VGLYACTPVDTFFISREEMKANPVAHLLILSVALASTSCELSVSRRKIVQLRQHYPVPAFDKDGRLVVAASGLSWHNTGATTPSQGRMLENPKLKEALMSKTQFEQHERDAFHSFFRVAESSLTPNAVGVSSSTHSNAPGKTARMTGIIHSFSRVEQPGPIHAFDIKDLRSNDYIEAGGFFFRPAVSDYKYSNDRWGYLSTRGKINHGVYEPPKASDDDDGDMETLKEKSLSSIFQIQSRKDMINREARSKPFANTVCI